MKIVYFIVSNTVSGRALVQSALVEFTNEITKALDESQATVGVFVGDLSKVFDCVDHSVLQYKLKDFGLGGNFYLLIQSYLQNINQRTVIFKDNIKYTSDWKNITSRVNSRATFVYNIIYK